MEELFQLGPNTSDHPDINLCIFLHLKEFLAIDLREPKPEVVVLDSTTIFDEKYLAKVESGFASILREPSEHPFAQFMDLPLRLEEHLREAGLIRILEKLDGGLVADDVPNISVYVIGGGSLEMGPEDVSYACRSLLGDAANADSLWELIGPLTRLVKQEREMLKRLNRQEIREALEDQSPNFFTLWERRN